MIKVVEVNREWWEREAAGFADYNYRQTWAFGLACAERVGGESRHVRIDSDGRLVGLADVRIKRIPVIGGGLAYVTGGPLVERDGLEGDRRTRLSTSVRGLVERFGDREGLTIRVAPSAMDAVRNEETSDVFAGEGFTPSEQGERRRTILVDLRATEEELRARLAQKWRNCLNAAEREGLRVEERSDAEGFRRFVALYGETSERKGFESNLDAAFHARVQEKAGARDRFVVTLVTLNGEDVAGHVGSELGETSVYLLGASNDAGRKSKASYLLQWSVMLRAKRAGCVTYDLGGIDAEGNPGVYRFKSGMGGVEVDAPGPFEHRTGWRGSVLAVAERFRAAHLSRRSSGVSE